MSVALSQEGSIVVSGSEDKTVQIWNAITGKVEAKLKEQTDEVMSVVFSQDGSRVVFGSYDNTVQIWNPKTGDSEAIDTPTMILPDASVINIMTAGFLPLIRTLPHSHFLVANCV